MAQLFKTLFSIFIVFFTAQCSFAALSGSVNYKIPIEYKNMNEEELSSKAEIYYNNALKNTDKKLNDDISEALLLYNALSNKNPNNIIYSLRAGHLYDILGKNRLAKGCFCKARGIAPTRPEPYFYFGEYYFKHQQYRMALKMYNRAYEYGYSNHSLTISRLKELSLILGNKEIAK